MHRLIDRQLTIRDHNGRTQTVVIPGDHVQRFQEITQKMADLLNDVQAVAPDACIYLDDEGQTYLMAGPPTVNLPGHHKRVAPENLVCVGIPWLGSSS